MLLLLPLENEIPIPAWGFGVLGFVVLVLGLLVVLAVGASRPHS